VSRRAVPRLAPRPARADFVVVTGLSGAGKSQALNALEDLGYYCVDNLPVALLPDLFALHRREDSGTPKIAVVVDVRERRFLGDFAGTWARLREASDVEPSLIFLEAADTALVRRFSETRRPHPLAPDQPVADAVRLERRKLARIRALADEIVDTSDLTVHELRQVFLALSRDRRHRARLVVTFESFGFKHGVPVDADLMFDVRFLPNPHFIPELRPFTGRDRRVAAFLRRQPETGVFVRKLVSLLTWLVPKYVAEGKSYLTVAIGCTGGRHRSVYVAEALRRELSGLKRVTLRTRHRDASRSV
jgi:UPF0042 nucleotide-binding protein